MVGRWFFLWLFFLLLLFPKTLRNDNDIIDIVLGTIDEGNNSVSLLEVLQRNALFYLQMAALLLLVFILLGPYLNKEEAVGGHTILIVDTSATMLASIEGTSLFEEIRKQ